jgi:hypothetical protein
VRLRTTCLVPIAAVTLAACGSSPSKTPAPAAKSPVHVTAGDTPCADLRTRAAAHDLARRLVDRVVAPDGQSQRHTIGIIGESLYATCKQPRLPGVANMDRYKPVKPVLAAIQRDFDEQEITGG